MHQTNTLLSNIRRIVRLYDSMLRPVCDRYGLAPIEATIISFLQNNPGRDTAADIVELRMLSKGNVSQAVESLIQKGLLKRIPDLHDRRRIHLALLPASHSITADVDTLMDEYRGYLFQGFSKEEFACYQILSKRLMENAKNAMKGRSTHE